MRVKSRQNPLYRFLFSYVFNGGNYTLTAVIAMIFGAFNSVLKEYLKRSRTIKTPTDTHSRKRETTILNTSYYWHRNQQLARKISAVTLGSEHEEIPVISFWANSSSFVSAGWFSTHLPQRRAYNKAANYLSDKNTENILSVLVSLTSALNSLT